MSLLPNFLEFRTAAVKIAVLLGILLTANRAFTRFQLLLRSLLPKCLLPAIRDRVKDRVSGSKASPERFVGLIGDTVCGQLSSRADPPWGTAFRNPLVIPSLPVLLTTESHHPLLDATHN